MEVVKKISNTGLKNFNSLRAKSKNEIPTVLDMFDIFKSMEENSLKISDNEKLICILCDN